MKKISIGVVDDHKLIRQMWALMFADRPDMEITGEGGTFDDAIEMIKLKKPDILLLDINLHEKNGMDALPLIRKFSPGTRIIAVSMHSQPTYAKKMLQLGARGYVTKNSAKEEIFKAIETVLKGDVYICSEIKENLAMNFVSDEPAVPNTNELSMREIEIIKLIKAGLTSKEISVQLFISTRTVEVHRHNILKKLNLKNTPSLINYINNTDLSFN